MVIYVICYCYWLKGGCFFVLFYVFIGGFDYDIVRFIVIISYLNDGGSY